MVESAKHEFRVIIERDIPESVAIEIEAAIRSATLSNIARMDLSRSVSVSTLLEGFGGTKGMILK